MTAGVSHQGKPAAMTPPAPTQLQALEDAGWRMIGASVRGPHHVARNIERQDSFAMEVAAGIAVAVVCDGAGSASHAAEGAARFTAAVLAVIACDIQSTGPGDLDLERFQRLVVQGVEDGRTALRQEGLSLHDHQATLLALAACGDATLIAHVGDGLGAVVLSADWASATLSLPENGAYANETFFVTDDDWADRLRCSRHAALGPGGVAVLLTDGAMPFVIGKDQTSLEPEFMAPVSRYLFEQTGNPAATALAGTLGSPDARRISADDKTLVWIGRLPA